MAEVEPKRIRRSRAKGARLPADAIYVGRPGPLGNPFKVGRDGTAAECVYFYEKMLSGLFVLTCTPSIEEMRAARQAVIDACDDLRGHDLACWCGLHKPCHADVLLKIANMGDKEDG